VFRIEVVSAPVSSVCVRGVEVHLFHCVSSTSVDSLGCYFGKEGIYPFGFDKASPGVFQLQPSPFYTEET